MRGDDHDDGSLWHLVVERDGTLVKMCPVLQTCMTTGCVHGTIENEIIELFALAVQHCLAYEILKSQFTGLTAVGIGRHLHMVTIAACSSSCK